MIRTDRQVIPDAVYPQVVNAIEREIENIMPGVPRQIIDSTASSVTYAFENPDTTNTLLE